MPPEPSSSATPALPATNDDSPLPQDEDTDATPRADPESLAQLPAASDCDSDADADADSDDAIEAKCDDTSLSQTLSPGKGIDTELALQWLDKILAEVSTASDKTLICGLSALAVVLNVLLGRVGLLLSGAVLGAVLHACLQDRNRLSDSDKPSALRAKALRDDEAKQNALPEDPHADFSSLNPKIASAMDELCNAIVKDCINSWYTPLIPDDISFPAICHQHLTQTFLRLSRRMHQKRPAEIFIAIVANMSDTVIMFMQELSQALSSTRDIKTGIRAYVKANRGSALAIMMNKGHQHRELSFAAQEIIQQYVSDDLTSSEPVVLFLRQVLRSTVLWNMVETFSDPEFINEWIIYLFECKDSTPSKEGVGAVLQAFDRSVAGAAQSSLPVVSAVVPELVSVIQSPTDGLSKEEVYSPVGTLGQAGSGDDQRPFPQVSTTILQDSQFITKSPTQSPFQSRPQSQSQSPTVRKENLPTFPAQTNGMNGGHHPHETVQYESIPNGKYTAEERKSLDGTSSGQIPSRHQSQTQSPVDVPSHSPTDDSLRRSSNASSHVSLSELSMTPYKTSSESSRSGTDPSQTEPKPVAISLFSARVTVLDSGPAFNPPRVLKAKPKSQFMIQVEPLDAAGWIVMKTYQDFELLHDTLIKLATPTGSTKYKLAYSEGLPAWKDRTSDELVSLLELFLRIALSEEGLANSETIFKFFQKDEVRRERERQERIENNVFWRSGAQIENVGKNILGTITKAPLTASEGGKAFLGGIKRALTSQTPTHSPGAGERENIRSPFAFIKSNSVSRSTFGIGSNDDSTISEKSSMSVDRDDASISGSQTDRAPGPNRGRFSLRIDFPRSFTIGDSNPPLPPRRAASASRTRASNYTPMNEEDDPQSARPASLLEEQTESTREGSMTFDTAIPELNGISLPLPPSEIDNDKFAATTAPAATMAAAAHEGITEPETQVVLGIMFSIINELYGLSTAWMIRRSFLNIAKSVILLPGNSTLFHMRNMIQADVLEANTSPEAIADYMRQIRKNSLPSEAERKEWETTHKSRTDEEKEELRRKARVVLSESLPQGLTALLGVNQTKEALSQLFDALQERDVARGLWTSLLGKSVQVLCVVEEQVGV